MREESLHQLLQLVAVRRRCVMKNRKPMGVHDVRIRSVLEQK